MSIKWCTSLCRNFFIQSIHSHSNYRCIYSHLDIKCIKMNLIYTIISYFYYYSSITKCRWICHGHVCMLGSELNMTNIPTQLRDRIDKNQYNMSYWLYVQTERNFRLFVEEDSSCAENLRVDGICFDMLIKDLKRAGVLTDREFYQLRNR